MRPGKDGGLGSSFGAVLMAAAVVVVLAVMIHVAGGLNHPLLASPHALAMARASNSG